MLFRSRAEKLLSEIDPSRVYTYEYLCYRITDFRPDAPTAAMPGEQVRHDLRLFVEDVSDSANVAAEEAGEPIGRFRAGSDDEHRRREAHGPPRRPSARARHRRSVDAKGDGFKAVALAPAAWTAWSSQRASARHGRDAPRLGGYVPLIAWYESQRSCFT